MDSALLHVLFDFPLDDCWRDLQGLVILFGVANSGLHFHIFELKLISESGLADPAAVSLRRDAA